MKINMSSWKNFLLGDIIEIINGKGITSEEIENNPGTFEAVQSGEGNNGVIGYIDKAYCQDKGYSYCEEPCLTVARSGTAGFVSFHEQGCVVGDSAKILLMKNPSARTRNVYLFLQTLLAANRFKYNYGRKVTETLYKQTVIKLPSTAEGNPDWKWIEKYVLNLNSDYLTTKNKSNNKNIRLNVCEWGEFQLDELFDVVYGVNLEYVNCIETDSRDPESIAFVSRTKSNNGVSGFVKPVLGIDPQERGLLTVAGGGSVLETFLQAQEFYSGRDLYLLYPKEKISLEAKLFIATIIKANKYRYNYGRQANVTLPYLKLRLPVTLTGNPDWEYMENYIKSLPYGDRIRQ